MAYPHYYNESEEDYLETILILSGRLPVVRSVDIANEKGFKKSSISIAMKKLREKSLITVTQAGFIYLTESGRKEAEETYDKHKTLRKCLEQLGVPEEIADSDACKMEHIISEETYKAIKKYTKQQKKKEAASKSASD